MCEFDFQTSQNQSDKLIAGSAANLNQTQSNGLRPIVQWINLLEQRLLCGHWSNLSIVTDFRHQFYKKSRVQKSKFDLVRLSTIFVWVRFGLVAKIEYDLVQFSSIYFISSIMFDWLYTGMLYVRQKCFGKCQICSGKLDLSHGFGLFPSSVGGYPPTEEGLFWNVWVTRTNLTLFRAFLP